MIGTKTSVTAGAVLAAVLVLIAAGWTARGWYEGDRIRGRALAQLRGERKVHAADVAKWNRALDGLNRALGVINQAAAGFHGTFARTLERLSDAIPDNRACRVDPVSAGLLRPLVTEANGAPAPGGAAPGRRPAGPAAIRRPHGPVSGGTRWRRD